MSYTSFSRVSPVLAPEEVAVLIRLFDEVCDDCGASPASERAQRCAGTLIRSFQRGIKDEQMLGDIGRAVLRS
jgi:hypothetical protein